MLEWILKLKNNEKRQGHQQLENEGISLDFEVSFLAVIETLVMQLLSENISNKKKCLERHVYPWLVAPPTAPTPQPTAPNPDMLTDSDTLNLNS